MRKYRVLNSLLLMSLASLLSILAYLFSDEILECTLIIIFVGILIILYGILSRVLLKVFVLKPHLVALRDLQYLKNGNYKQINERSIYEIAELFIKNMENAKQVNAYISHELKNKLAITLSMIEGNQNKKEIVDQIMEMNKSISDIQSLSAIDGIELNEEIDLALLCAEIIDEYRIKYNDIQFEFESVSTIFSKRFLLYSAISNLLDNAIKYGNDKEIIVSVVEKDGAINIEVLDHGKGIDDQILSETWKINKQFNLINKSSYGIGLSLVKNVMDLMGGFVWVESKKDEFTKVILSFPL